MSKTTEIAKKCDEILGILDGTEQGFFELVNVSDATRVALHSYAARLRAVAIRVRRGAEFGSTHAGDFFDEQYRLQSRIHAISDLATQKRARKLLDNTALCCRALVTLSAAQQNISDDPRYHAAFGRTLEKLELVRQ